MTTAVFALCLFAFALLASAPEWIAALAEGRRR